MKVYLYSEFQKLIERSGVGRALHHQRQALKAQGIQPEEDRNKADIIHINTVFWSSYRLAKWARRNGKTVVYHAHSTREDFRNSYIGSNLLADLFGRWLMKCYRLGDVIITPSNYAKNLLQSYGIKQPISVLSNGIDLNYYQPQANDRAAFCKKYHYRPEDKIIMSAGLWIERKGILDFAALAEQMPEYQFIWFGESNLCTVPDKVKAVIKKKLPNLIFAGYVEREELRQAYGACDLFLFPSLEETEGIVVLEALAMKIPVIVRDIPVYESWLKDGVNCYKANSLAEFALKIQGVLEQDLPDIRQAEYQVATDKSIVKIGEGLAAVYRAALEIDVDPAV